MRIVKTLFLTFIALNVILFFIHLCFVLKVTLHLEPYQCWVDHYFHQNYVEVGEEVYHIVRMILLALIVAVLIESTALILRSISKGSSPKHFKTELRNTVLAFWSFVLCYLLWLIFYVYELIAEFKDIS
mmetsp:Transcript_31291/g.38703  ORF Transcript_31291/g.38703 Transcript_31291/m.38703 type:complete len:129 (-) Transcript_31291:1007-1393(-)